MLPTLTRLQKMADQDPPPATEEAVPAPEEGGAAADAPAKPRMSVSGDNGAQTLSAQTNQVESETPIKDPVTDVPHNLVMMSEMTKENLLDAVKTRFKHDGASAFPTISH
jgi:hypothetical protein